MSVRVRFAPSPTGSLHLGNALTAVANRRFVDESGGVLVLRIDDTDPARTIAGGEEAILDDLAWLIEELRVQVFAPELKTAVAVSPARVQELWSALSR